MESQTLTFRELSIKTIVTHTASYFIMGLIAVTFLGYSDRFATPAFSSWMRSVDDPIVMTGPLFQPIRGLVFAMVFFPLREVFFQRKNGWLVMFWMLVGIGIINPFAPPPGSIEGLIYTKIPLYDQLIGLLEVVPQAFLLSFVLFYWIENPEKRWISWVMWALFVIIIVLMILGILFG
ncbi:hypothetical protein ACFLYP_01335 [Chloroflexota bacterium]